MMMMTIYVNAANCTLRYNTAMFGLPLVVIITDKDTLRMIVSD